MLQGAACLYGLQEARQTGYLSARRGLNSRIFLLSLSGRASRTSMDSFELNKILGAVLGTCLVLLSLNIAAGAIFAPHKPAKPGFEIAVPEQAGAEAAAKPEPAEPIAVRLANSDPKRGEAAAKQCASCHTFDKGGANLYGIVNRPKASVAGFNYSAPLKAKGGNWSYEDLDQFLAAPKAYVPGTSMSYAGLARGGQRADLINYLRTLADNPAPLPQAAQAPAK
jgi:cytochrome c